MTAPTSPQHRCLLGTRATRQAVVESLSMLIDAPGTQAASLLIPSLYAESIPAELSTRVGCAISYPTGQAHRLVKYAEARLAYQSGAGFVAVAAHSADLIDGGQEALNRLLEEAVTLREGLPHPARLHYAFDLSLCAYPDILSAAIRAVAHAGSDAVELGLNTPGWEEPALSPEAQATAEATGLPLMTRRRLAPPSRRTTSGE